MTAWLKYHYTAEYMSAVMSHATYKKLPQFISNCHRMGLHILPPDINRSMNDFTSDGEVILYGFGNVKGVGKAGPAIVRERTARGSFTSVKDFVIRMQTNTDAYTKTVMENLIKTGAFDAFCDGNRQSLLNSIEEYASNVSNLLKKRATVAERQAALDELIAAGASAEAIKKAERLLASGQKSLSIADTLCTSHVFVRTPEDNATKLANEYELLGVYLSGNPFDDYSEAATKLRSRVQLADMQEAHPGADITVCGIIRDLRVLRRNKDGAEFAVFTIFDDTGEVEVKCFTSSYAEYRQTIADGVAVSIAGRVTTDSKPGGEDADSEPVNCVSVREITALKRNANERIIITAENLIAYYDHQDEIAGYQSATGYAAFYCDTADKTLRATELTLSGDILSANMSGIKFSLSHI